MYTALKAKYDTKSNIDATAKIIDYDRVRSSFTGHGDLTFWADALWNSYSDILEMRDKYDPEFVSVMELLLL